MAAQRIPYHLAIIMDGNRRWAYKRNKPTKTGHDYGSKIIEKISQHAHDRGVSWLTLFAFSSENWKRSSLELKGIMAVLRHYLNHEMQSLIDNNIKLRVIGDLTGFDNDIKGKLAKAEKNTVGNTGLNLTIALGYGGQADLMQAAIALAKKVEKGQLKPSAINEEMIKAELYTQNLPVVDLLIRTGGEQRISNFLLWDLAYAEMAFVDPLWPDFTIAILDEIFDQYANRNRRFGGDSTAEFLLRSMQHLRLANL